MSAKYIYLESGDITPERTGVTFKQAPPGDPGLYWYKLIEESSVHFCHVWRQQWDGKLVANSGGVPSPVERFGRFWSVDFLPEPEECGHR